MIDLALVKLHLRVDHDEEDALIQGYLAAALEHVQQHCDRHLVEGEPILPTEMGLTQDVKHAVLLLVAHWYTNREAVAGAGVATVPLGVDRLLWYRKRF